MKAVKVYTTTYCPYCVRAKDLLKSSGIDFEEITLAEDDDQAWEELTKKSKMQTVPQIFYGEKLIGGFTDLQKLSKEVDLKTYFTT